MPATYDQRMAERAFQCVQERSSAEYRTFALSFPALIHSCGLAQAVAFAEVKKRGDYLDDLGAVLNAAHGRAVDLPTESRGAQLSDYIRLSRHALAAASWLKRYAQALTSDAGTAQAETARKEKI